MLDTPYEFVLSDGETYQFAPTTLRDWAAFARWANGREGRNANALLPFDDLMAQAQTLDGMLWLVHRSVSKSHKLTQDALMDLIGSLERLGEIAVLIISTGDSTSGNPPAGEEPAT